MSILGCKNTFLLSKRVYFGLKNTLLSFVEENYVRFVRFGVGGGVAPRNLVSGVEILKL